MCRRKSVRGRRTCSPTAQGFCGACPLPGIDLPRSRHWSRLSRCPLLVEFALATPTLRLKYVVVRMCVATHELQEDRASSITLKVDLKSQNSEYSSYRQTFLLAIQVTESSYEWRDFRAKRHIFAHHF